MIEKAADRERQLREWIADFEAAARRTLSQRMEYAFIHTYKPVLDDEPFRAFDTMEDYRRWCESIDKITRSFYQYGCIL